MSWHDPTDPRVTQLDGVIHSKVNLSVFIYRSV